MAKDRKKIQQKRAKKAAKHRTQQAEKKKKIAAQGGGVPMALRQAVNAPVHECWEAQELFQKNCGIGYVVITRKTLQQQIVIAVFLVDAFCLGIKDAFIRLVSERDYRMQLQSIKMNQQVRPVAPERARKLLESAEAYARELGFSPHKDYQGAKKIFGDIDAEVCHDTFEFGQNGQPMYIAGPNDSFAFQQRVLQTLARHGKLEGDSLRELSE